MTIPDEPQTTTSRRNFITSTAAAAVGAGLLLNPEVSRTAHAAGDDTIKVGLVGCGGRGRGSAVQALKADPNTRLVALADVFSEKKVEVPPIATPGVTPFV